MYGRGKGRGLRKRPAGHWLRKTPRRREPWAGTEGWTGAQKCELMVQSGDCREFSRAGRQIARSLGKGEKKGLPSCEGLEGEGSALGLSQVPRVRGCSETGCWGETSLRYTGPGVGMWEMLGAGVGGLPNSKGAAHQERAEKSRLMA